MGIKAEGKIIISVEGWYDIARAERVISSILINGFEEETESYGVTLKNLPVGKYEIKYDLADNIPDSVMINNRIIKLNGFIFDFSNPDLGDTANISFFYSGNLLR